MHLIFDLDGTLINSLPGIAQSLNASLNEHDMDGYPVDTIRGFIGDGSRTLCHRAAPNAEQHLIDSLEAGFKKHYSAQWKQGTTIYSGILELLTAIPDHHHLSVLSNKPHSFTTEIVEQLFPSDTFHTVLGQRQGIAKKPDPKGIHEIINNSGHSDQSAFLIGDSTVDLATAKRASITSIAVTWGFEDPAELESANPDHIASTTAELHTLIHSL